MEKKITIPELIKKLQDDTISAWELNLLYSTIKHNPSEMDDLMVSEWENMASASSEINVNAVLKSIHKKGNFKSSAGSPGEVTKPNIRKRIIPVYMRYAAIFIIAFGLAWFLHTADSASYADNITNVSVAYGSKTTIELPDGSIVKLNSGSKLSYPSSFGRDNRTVVLKGEGFFEVKKNAKVPFYVKTSGMTVKVTGTKFNVKAYPDEYLTETTLVSGSVEIFENKNIQNPKLLAVLKPNQKAIFTMGNIITEDQEQKNNESVKLNHKNDVSVITPIIAVEKNVEAEVLTSWKNNVLNIDNEKLSDLTRKLERWYNVEIKIKDDNLCNIRFSGKFDKESIQDVLSAFAIVHPITYDIRKNKIVIKSKIY